MCHRSNNAVVSPNYGILIGEAVRTDSGQYALRVKKPRENIYEVILIEEFLAMFYDATRDSA